MPHVPARSFGAWIRVGLFWLSLALLQISPAFAQAEDDPPTADASAQAALLIDEGVALRKAGNERDALEKFRQAHELHPSPRALAQMGLAEKSLRSYLEAERHLDEAMSFEDDPWIAKNGEALAVAKLVVAKQLAWVTVTSNVAGAELVVNGTVVGKLPLAEPHRVVAGVAVIELRSEGYTAKRSEVPLPAGVVRELDIHLEQIEPTAPAPAAPTNAPSTAPAPIAPAPAEATSWTPWIVTTAAVSAVGLAIGIGLGVHTLNLKDERDAICPDQTCTTQAGVDLDEEARAMSVGSTVGFVVAGVAAAVTLVLWLAEPEDAASTADQVLSPAADGVLLRF